MKKINNLTLLIGFSFLISLATVGCAHSIHQYSVGDFSSSSEAHPGRVINSEAEQFVVLSLAFDTDYAEQAYQKLLASCPQGEIVGINARHSTSMSFLSYTNKMRLEAVCLD